MMKKTVPSTTIVPLGELKDASAKDRIRLLVTLGTTGILCAGQMVVSSLVIRYAGSVIGAVGGKLAPGEEIVEVNVARLEELDRGEHFGRTDASVVIYIHQLESTGVEPDAFDRHRDSGPELAVGFGERGDIGAAGKGDLVQTTSAEVFEFVGHGFC